MICLEIMKQLKKPYFWVFLGICLVINIYSIFTSLYSINNVMMDSGLVSSIGTARIGEEYQEYVREKTGDEFIIGDFAAPGDGANALSNLMGSNLYLDNFFSPSSGSTKLYLFLMGETSIPELAEKRLMDINEKGDHLWINGGASLMHLLFDLLWFILGESAFFAVLTAVKCGGHEISEGTGQIVYSTKLGRTLGKYKLFASIVLSLGFLGILTLIGYAVLFILCPCFNLLNSSYFVCELGTVSIPWISVTVLQYLLMSIALGAAVIVLLTLIGYCCWGFIRNVYVSSAFGIGVLAVMFFGTLALPASLIKLFGLSTPVMLLFCCPGRWFALSNRSTPIPGFELISVFFWGIILSLLSVMALRKLKRMKL